MEVGVGKEEAGRRVWKQVPAWPGLAWQGEGRARAGRRQALAPQPKGSRLCLAALGRVGTSTPFGKLCTRNAFPPCVL